MTRCSQAGCAGTDLRCYRLALRGTLRVFCQSCADSLIGLGMAWEPVERRQVVLPVVTERRKTFRPAWLRNLRDRDQTGLVLAA